MFRHCAVSIVTFNFFICFTEGYMQIERQVQLLLLLLRPKCIVLHTWKQSLCHTDLHHHVQARCGLVPLSAVLPVLYTISLNSICQTNCFTWLGRTIAYNKLSLNDWGSIVINMAYSKPQTKCPDNPHHGVFCVTALCIVRYTHNTQHPRQNSQDCFSSSLF